MPIRIKLTLIILAIVSVPLLMMSAVTFTNYQNSLEDDSFSQLRDLARFKADRIEAYFAELRAEIEMAQSFYIIRKHLPALIQSEGTSYYRDAVARNALDGQLRRIQKVLRLSDIILTDNNGFAVYVSDPDFYAKDLNGPFARWQPTATRGGRDSIYFSDIFISKPAGNKPEMLIAAPAYDLNNHPIGTIVFEADLLPLYELLRDTTGLGKTGEVLIGKMTGANELRYLNPLRHDPAAALKRSVRIGDSVGIPIQKAVQGQTGIGQSIDYRGKKVVAAWRPLSSLGWGLVAKIDNKEAFEDVTQLKKLVFVLLAVIFIMVVLITSFVARSISRPIKLLTKGAAIIGSGNLEHRVGTSHKDEIGQLSRAFDKMTHDLKTTIASRDELNREIAERKLAEKALRKSEEGLKRLSQNLEKKVDERTEEIKNSNELLRLEVAERTKAEAALVKRQEVLESIYAIETTFTVSLEDVFDQVAITISNLVNLPYVAVGRIEKGRLTALAQLTDNKFSHEKAVAVTAHPCGIVLQEKKVCQYAGKLKSLFPEEMWSQYQDYSSYVGVPMFDKDGTLIGAICAMGSAERTFSDLELHSMEIFARYIGHEIEHEIMDDQLRAAGEMNLLGRIASGVAHEVRNPLNGILAISEALFLEIGDNPEHLPYLEHIKTQVNRLSLLMKDLLDLGKPLTRSEFTPQPLDRIIHTVIDSLKHASSHKNHTVNFTPSPADVPTMIKADNIKLQQVFVNLIENACEHSPEHEPITLEMSVIAETEPKAVVRVIDRGSGIPPALLEKVFDPFFTTRKGGTGLGLSIVRHIVQLHGGIVVMANNTPGPGVTAEVRLPLYKQ
jgi:signal transduction histidine kinase/HAMP domain-containing protein